MKKVAVELSEPRHIDGKLRRPQEGAITVPEDEAKRIVDDKAGKIAGKAKAAGKDSE